MTMDKLRDLIEVLMFPVCICAAIVAVAYLIWCGIDNSNRWTAACLQSGQSVIGNTCVRLAK
jgi:hypothetical protein